MEQVLAGSDVVADVARATAPSRRYWAVVGSGTNRVAAAEIRIKLSELCYKAIACDTTEDKKHIDLSSEPLILVCAAGLTGGNADDVAKEVAIYRAHKAAPVVITSEGGHPFTSALHVITVPTVHPSLAFVLSVMVGHLFGYHAALAIDAQARPLRQARASVEEAVAHVPGGNGLHGLNGLFDRLAEHIRPPAEGVLPGAAGRGVQRPPGGRHRGAAGVVTSLRRRCPAPRGVRGRVRQDGVARRRPAGPVRRPQPGDRRALPSDRRHQAPGQDRHRGHLPVPGRAPADSVRSGRAGRGAILDRLSYRALRTLAALDPAVAEVTGYTRYRVDGEVGDKARSTSSTRAGSGWRPARTDTDPTLRGTKRGAPTPARSPSPSAGGTAAPSCWSRRPRASSRSG